MKNNITVLLTTCDRYDTSLPLCLLSILNQTRKPDRIVIVDDSVNNKFYNNAQIKQLLVVAKYKNISIDYYLGDKKGAVPALQRGYEKIKDGWVLKVDDDHILNSDIIELYESNITDEIGAMGCIIIDNFAFTRKETDVKMSSKMEDFFSHFNVQMVLHQSEEPKEVEHIYSSYFFRKEALDKFPVEIQPSSIREETIVTYSIFRKNYKLLVFPKGEIYHLHNNDGNKKWGDEHVYKNQLTFIEKLKEWKVVPDKISLYRDEKYYFTVKNGTKYIVTEIYEKV